MNIIVKYRPKDGRGLAAALLIAMSMLLLCAMPARALEIDSVVLELGMRSTSPVGSVRAMHIAVDDSGNRYVLGSFSGQVEFGQGADGQRLTGTFGDMFVARYDAAGGLQWIRELESRFVRGAGGPPSAGPAGIELDQNDLYVTGHFINTLDVGPETLRTSDSSSDGFIAQLDPATGQVRWVNQIRSRGSLPVIVRDISAARGNVYITGRFGGTGEFEGQFESGQTLFALSGGGSDMFVARYSFGGILAFAIQAGGEEAEGLGIDTTSGQSFTVAGAFSGTIRFPGTASNPTARLTSRGGEDGFVAKYKDDRLRRDLLVQIGGPGSDSAVRVLENRTTTYVAGVFRDTITIGGRPLSSQGQSDNYLARINLLGDVDRVVQIASNNTDFIQDLDADAAGNVSITGEFLGTELTLDDGGSAIHLPADGGTAYIAGASRELIPLFGQTIQGKVKSHGLVVGDNADIHIATEYRGTVAFGEGDRTIVLPAPGSFSASGMAVARYIGAD